MKQLGRPLVAAEGHGNGDAAALAQSRRMQPEQDDLRERSSTRSIIDKTAQPYRRRLSYRGTG